VTEITVSLENGVPTIEILNTWSEMLLKAEAPVAEVSALDRTHSTASQSIAAS